MPLSMKKDGKNKKKIEIPLAFSKNA